MGKVTTIAQWTLRVSGLLQLLLGLAIWIFTADGLINVHIAIGVVLVIALWVLAGLAIGRAPLWQAVLAFAWGLLLPVLGLTQAGLLDGGFHWTIQVLHLLIGVAAIGLGEALASAIRAARTGASPATPA